MLIKISDRIAEKTKENLKSPNRLEIKKIKTQHSKFSFELADYSYQAGEKRLKFSQHSKFYFRVPITVIKLARNAVKMFFIREAVFS
jgi:hypothetical protein